MKASGHLLRANATATAGIISNNKTMADSQQSVFERLTQSRQFVKSVESAGHEEFKNVL